MKPSQIFILVLNALISLALLCVIVRLYASGQEKDHTILMLQSQKQIEAQKAAKAQQEEEAQKQFEAQVKLDEQRKLDAGKITRINDDLDRVGACLKKVLDVPSGFASESKAQRDTQEELLRQLAEAARTEIQMLSTEMQEAGFTNDAPLRENLDKFFQNYETKIHDERMSFDFVDLGFSDSDRKRQLDSESAESQEAAFAARRAVLNLKVDSPVTADKSP